jgi:hypothetical protein
MFVGIEPDGYTHTETRLQDRENSMYKTYKYTAPGVTAEITPTDFGRILFDAHDPNGMGKKYPGSCCMYVKGKSGVIAYGYTAHFYKWQDGSWNIGQEGGRQASSMHGKGHMTRANDPWRATSNTAAHIKADEIATGIVRQWAADHPEALLEAHRETVRLEIAKIQVRIDDLRGEIEAETAKTAALQERL